MSDIVSLINKVHCAEFLEFSKEKIPNQSINMILTDPPYGIDYWSNRSQAHERIENDKAPAWTSAAEEWIVEMGRIMLPEAVCCIFSSGGGPSTTTAKMQLIIEKHMHLIQTVVWDKMGPGLGWRYRPAYDNILIGSKSGMNYAFHDTSKSLINILRYPNVIPAEGDHPTPKPVPLLVRLLEIHSRPGQIILDPFLGGGSTAVACTKTGRNYIGIEINPQYCEMAEKKTKGTTLGLGLDI
jgi:site-specific DNA-methyltransferase (adenine-specific)